MDIIEYTFVLDLICCIGISLSSIQDTRMDCISGCTGVDDGDYQACDGCNVYVTCSNERIYDSRLCPGNLVWDDNKKRCQATSNTCVRTGDIGKCVFDCTNKADGDYQSCLGCGFYVTCSNGVRHDNRPCPSNLVWDDNVKRCQYISTTCRKDRQRLMMDLSRMISVFGMTLCLSLIVSRTEGARPYCVTDCNGLDDGDYQSCQGCDVYASCSNGYLFDKRPCPPGGLVWDDNKQRCEFYSDTCGTLSCGLNEELDMMDQCICKPGFRLQDEACVEECSPGRENGNTFITYPGQGVRCFQKSFFFTPYLEQCLYVCRQNFFCRSVTYFSFGLCYHSPCDQRRNFLGPQLPIFVNNLQGATLYIRNCKQGCD